MILVRRIYDLVEQVLLVSGIAMGLVAIWAILHIPQARERFERIRAQEISEENSHYCEKWGRKVGTHEYTLCTIDLYEIRQNQTKRMSDGMIF
jgi:hypothetical protein